MSSFDLITQCQNILKINSASSHVSKLHRGNSEVVQFLNEICRDHLQTKIFKTPGRPNDWTFFAWPKKRDFPKRGGLALHTHLDTVQPGDLKKWTLAKPFSGKRIGEKIVGLGSADVKCDSLCKISALMSLANADLKRTPFFVGSFGEEIGLLGMKWITKMKWIRPEIALVGEPSDGHLSYANKGFAWSQFRIPIEWSFQKKKSSQAWKGRSAHSSSPAKGINALELFLKDLARNKLFAISSISGPSSPNSIPGELKIEAKGKIVGTASLNRLLELWKAHQLWIEKIQKKKMAIFSPASATSQWTQASIVGDEWVGGFDFRFLPTQNPETLLKPLLKNFRELSFERESPAFFQSPTHSTVKTLAACLPAGKNLITKAGSNEASFYKKLGAIALVHGPGKSYGNIHSPNECNDIKSFLEAEQFYATVIRRLCLS